MRSARLVAGLLAAAMLTACGTRGTPAPPPSPTAAAGPPVTKILTFVEENHSLSQMKAGMPYAYSLARRFGYATGYTAIGHPSLPNYLAIAGGRTAGVTDDAPPAAHPVRGPSIFGQAIAAGKTAAAYVDGMPNNCALVDGGDAYAVKHNPWAYYVDERALCNTYDVPLGEMEAVIRRGDLPTVGMVIPNLDHDAHDASLGRADAWFKRRMKSVLAGPDWRSGRLAVVLTADEDDRRAGNRVLTVVIHRSQRGAVVSTPLTHYSLTRLYEDVAGVRHLYEAADATSMSDAFGLPLLR